MSKYLNFESYLVDCFPLLNSILESIGENDENIIWKSLMHVFILHKKDSILIGQCTSKELELTEKESLLLRGGGVYIRILSEYVNIYGKCYIREALGPLIRKIAKGNSLEVDPCRIKSDNPQELQENRQKLCKACQKIFNLIISSTQQIPIRVKQVFWELNDRIGKNFPNSFNRIIGAFFFLRFICPAIVHPEHYGILNDCSIESRRKLTLVTKLLQNIANESILEEKEPYMTFFNDFVKMNIEKLPTLCEKLLDTTQSDKEMVEFKKNKVLDDLTSSIYNFTKERFDTIKHKLELHSLEKSKEIIDVVNKIVEETDLSLAEEEDRRNQRSFARRRSTTPVRSEVVSPIRLSTPTGSKPPRRSSVDSALGSRISRKSSTDSSPYNNGRGTKIPRLPSVDTAISSVKVPTYDSITGTKKDPEIIFDPDTSLTSSRDKSPHSRKSVPSIVGAPLFNFVRNRLSTTKEIKRYSYQSRMGALYEEGEEEHLEYAENEENEQLKVPLERLDENEKVQVSRASLCHSLDLGPQLSESEVNRERCRVELMGKSPEIRVDYRLEEAFNEAEAEFIEEFEKRQRDFDFTTEIEESVLKSMDEYSTNHSLDHSDSDQAPFQHSRHTSPPGQTRYLEEVDDEDSLVSNSSDDNRISLMSSQEENNTEFDTALQSSETCDKSLQLKNTNSSDRDFQLTTDSEDDKKGGGFCFPLHTSRNKKSKSAPSSPSLTPQMKYRISAVIPDVSMHLAKFPALIMTARSESPIREMSGRPELPKTLSCDSLDLGNSLTGCPKEKKKKRASLHSSTYGTKREKKAKEKDRKKKKKKKKEKTKEPAVDALENFCGDGTLDRSPSKKTIVFSSSSQSMN